MSNSTVFVFHACSTFTDLISLNELIHDSDVGNPVTVATNGVLMTMTVNVV